MPTKQPSRRPEFQAETKKGMPVGIPFFHSAIQVL
jgi:hypothetical protein